VRNVAEIDKEIAELQRQLQSVKGTETEIYTRIVGYYRSLKNWNKGKREEYDHRQTFNPGEQTRSDRAKTAVSESLVREQDRHDVGTSPRSTASAGAPTATATAATVTRAPAAETTGITYRYFYRVGCGGCEPVRQKLADLGLRGGAYDVDSEEGFAMAAHHEIMATPTVIFYGVDGETLGRATSVHEIDAFVAP
jgi:ribonucleoside-triphosphate reductase